MAKAKKVATKKAEVKKVATKKPAGKAEAKKVAVKKEAAKKVEPKKKEVKKPIASFASKLVSSVVNLVKEDKKKAKPTAGAKAEAAKSGPSKAKLEASKASSKVVEPKAAGKASKATPKTLMKAESPSKADDSNDASQTQSAKPAKAEKAPKAPKAPKPEKVRKTKADKASVSASDAKWDDLFEKYGNVRASTYQISGQYEAGAGLQHKIFGWGWVLSNEYDRLDVLFKDGRKMLISNRK